jgi:hypothetical protein
MKFFADRERGREERPLKRMRGRRRGRIPSSHLAEE